MAILFVVNVVAPTDPYPLSLHDALPIWNGACGASSPTRRGARSRAMSEPGLQALLAGLVWGDRKSTRLNSSHVAISYAVFCLKKKIMVEHKVQEVLSSDVDYIGSLIQVI